VLSECVAYRARARPAKTACLDVATGTRTSYAALDLRSSRLAATLTRLAGPGSARGARIAVLARNLDDYAELIDASFREHAIPYFSTGSRKSLWTVIERASREWFDEAPNISAIRSSAIDGNRVFQWVGTFDQASVTDDQFQAFLDAAEAWILAQATDDSEPTVTGDDEDEEDIDAELEDSEDDWDK